MRSIVVPVNFTENSNNAARYAADMALAIDGDIHLIYVFQLPLTIAEFPIPDAAIEEMQRDSRITLNALKDELRQRTRDQVGVTTEMIAGSIEHNLEEYCKRQKPFVVVMGASGHSVENALTGGSTVKAMRHLPWPLLVIPENAAFHAIKKIVLACDLDDIGDGIPASLTFINDLTASSAQNSTSSTWRPAPNTAKAKPYSCSIPGRPACRKYSPTFISYIPTTSPPASHNTSANTAQTG